MSDQLVREKELSQVVQVRRQHITACRFHRFEGMHAVQEKR